MVGSEISTEHVNLQSHDHLETKRKGQSQPDILSLFLRVLPACVVLHPVASASQVYRIATGQLFKSQLARETEVSQ